jgi:hypothetical protein
VRTNIDRPRFDQSQFADIRFKEERKRAARPGGVGLIAGFQLIKGAVLVLTALVLHWNPNEVLSPQSPFYPILYVATRGNVVLLNAAVQGSNILPAFFFILGSYLSAIGLGLWQIQKWARRTVMFTSGMTLLLWAKATLLDSAPSFVTSSYGTSSPDLKDFYILLFFDLVVFAYLVRGSIADLFDKRAFA